MPRKIPKAEIPSDDVVASILKDFGEDVATSGDSLLDVEKVIIPVCPTLDLIHNGGLQEGTFVIFSGQPRCGKTTTSLHFAGKAQSAQYGHRQVIFLNTEARLERRDLQGIGDLKTDLEHFVLIRSIPPYLNDKGEVIRAGKILTAKDYLKIAERFLINTTRRVVILDSVSAMIGESEWMDGLDSVAMGEAQRLFSKFMRRMVPVIATNKHIFIGTVHLYSNLSNTGPKWLEKMSSSANYGLATKFKSTHFTTIRAGNTKDGEAIGQEVHWICERSPLGPPGSATTSTIRYGQGIDEVKEIIDFAIDINLIEKNGTWYYMRFLPKEGKGKNLEHPKAQGPRGKKLID
jgi:RecA/RadA recombinase